MAEITFADFMEFAREAGEVKLELQDLRTEVRIVADHLQAMADTYVSEAQTSTNTVNREFTQAKAQAYKVAADKIRETLRDCCALCNEKGHEAQIHF
ncbi:hypothetical protein [Mycobacterium phage PP]|uniref:Uncharacterized protein n=1 Tax=Mycobacterium phage PP TaxID=2077134 RepID=A0A2Z5XVC3_9CAUD|nr:hypothetical protein KIW36_gp10 [Mycobacterium phage PP]BBC53804.1 hypothetical protein [Mycobacterium phage PP]